MLASPTESCWRFVVVSSVGESELRTSRTMNVATQSPRMNEHSLPIHVQPVHAQKQYIAPALLCPVEGCPRTFRDPSQRAIHVRSAHTGERPFACQSPGCNKAFFSSGDLRKHNRVHSTGSFTCPHCSKSVKSKKSLRLHIAALHSQVWFTMRGRGLSFEYPLLALVSYATAWSLRCRIVHSSAKCRAAR